MGIFDFLVASGELDKQDKEEQLYTTAELKNLGLDREEIRLVQEEGWDPSDFNDDEDEEHEDDDYYGEDYDDQDDDEDDDDEWV